MFEKRFQAMSDNANGDGQFYNNYNGAARNHEEYDEETIRKDLLSGRVDSSLKQLDMGVIQQEIYQRSRTAMEVGCVYAVQQRIPSFALVVYLVIYTE